VRRIVFVLLLAAVVWLGQVQLRRWGVFGPGTGGPGTGPGSGFPGATGAGATTSAQPVMHDLVLKPASQPAAQAGGQGTAAEAAQLDQRVARLAAAIAAREAGGIAEGLAFLADAQGSGVDGHLQDRVGAALSTAAAGTKSGNELLDQLGTNNAFVHTKEGRKLAAEVLKRAAGEAPEQAATTLTRLVELAMRGPIEKGDAEARTAVDTIYGALKVAVQRTTLNPAYLSHARQHKVESGQVLATIAKTYSRETKIPIEAMTLALVNQIRDPRYLRAGTVIKIPLDPVKTVIEKRSFLMAVYVGETIVRLYWIAHGKDSCTPEATFTIGEKQEKPDWFDSHKGKQIPYGHPDNPLGDYFVSFKHEIHRGLGAHGTTEPDSIGTMASRGCIRLRDEDVKEFFQIVPRASVVDIRAD
jgi:lipoprotein-anchoring transpeptidase ErfK/SrfK